jgi:amino acid adenylation domain-containing protein
MTAVDRAMLRQIRNSDVLEQQWLRNDTSDNYEDTITSRFDQELAVVPDKLALVTDESSLTYRSLDFKASRIAAALALLSSQRDQPIALFMKDEAARMAAMLGALKASRIFIPLASDSPEKWLTQVIEDSGTAHIIVDSSTRSSAELAATGSVTVMEVEQLVRSLEPFVAARTASPDDTAYIVYTSGSTGRPKGVANSHRSLIRRVDVRRSLFGLGRSDRYANLRSSGVSVAVNVTFAAVLSGGCLLPFDLHRHGLQKLAPWLIAQKITYVSFSGSLLRTWLASLPGDLRFPVLRFVEANSEPLWAQDVIRLTRHLEGDWRIGHSYASTESGLIAAQIFTSSYLPGAGIVAVGHSVDGVDVCIKDETGALVQRGEIGEIVVRSRFLAQGYWNNPDLTAEAFQTDPVDNAIRIYRSGDVGRFRSDGALEHLGRKGRRIRLRGYTIEPFQVERELMRQRGITDAIVLLHESAAGQEPCLVGYVVAPSNASPSAMREALAERLPSYMVPSHIVVLDSFPIASSGKIDRNALPPPHLEEPRVAAFRAPSDDRERALLAIWQDVLRIPNIGIDDDFFELGGTSLQALTVFLEIEAQLGCILSPTIMVQAPTIARLAEFIRVPTGIDASQSLLPLRTCGTGLPLFLVIPPFCCAGMHYRHLVRDLKNDRPVFGLQLPPLDGKHRIPPTIELMAADFVIEIRRVQPHGPYFLAGHSFAGKVSFEIAQQLVGKGERVSFLGLIDAVRRDNDKTTWMSGAVKEAVRLGRKVGRVHSFQDLLFTGLSSLHFRALSNVGYTRNLLLNWWFRLVGSIPYRYQHSYYDWFRHRASRNYVHKPYSGHITMFSSAGNSKRQRADWGPLARDGLTVLEVATGHDDMVKPPYSKLLAERFDACLDTNAPERVPDRAVDEKRNPAG